MVDQAFAAIAVVLKQPFEPVLLENDLFVPARPAVLSGMALDRLVIDLRPAGKRGQDVVADGTDVEFVQATRRVPG